MIKYFHQLDKKEYTELVKQKLTYGELAKQYPQPKWCKYPGATEGLVGCWGLTSFKVKDDGEYCKDCEYNRG